MNGILKVDFDPQNAFGRQLTELEQRQLPYALMQATNAVAEEVKYQWTRQLATQLNKPTAFTLKSVGVKRASYTRGEDGTRTNNAAEVYIRDEAVNGTAPARYLGPLVYGGQRSAKGLESGLRRIGMLGGSERAVPGKGETLDAYGNVRNGVVQTILAQLGAQKDALSNTSGAKRKGRKVAAKTMARRFFVVRGVGRKGWVVNRDGSSRNAGLHAGIYERVGKYKLRSVFIFVRSVTYSPRLDLFDLAARTYQRVMPFFLNRELTKAIESSMHRGRL